VIERGAGRRHARLGWAGHASAPFGNVALMAAYAFVVIEIVTIGTGSYTLAD
jgi:hypothetical protein